ncbi:uncharacterized protein LOC143296124 [Babylonia areolata]|uniref:uncharacterized protein LOC143296124 n=1 Tax=Babylonia areolata TaxID=304850 RepID=UPI003FD6B92F
MHRERSVCAGGERLQERTGETVVPSIHTSCSLAVGRNAEDNSMLAMQIGQGRIDPSGDAPHVDFHHGADTVHRQRLMAGHPFCALTSQSGGVTEKLGRKRERWESNQQNTQGFSAAFSQGFVPQLTEGTGTLLFETDTGKGRLCESVVQTDSPLSTHSTGFSPAAADPLLTELSSQNRGDCSAGPEVAETPWSGTCANFSGSRIRSSQTSALGDAHTDADSCPSQNRNCQTRNTLAKSQSSSQPVAQSLELTEGKNYPDSIPLLRLSQADLDSQVIPCCQRLGQSSSAPNGSQLRAGVITPCSEVKSSSLTSRQLSCDNCQLESQCQHSQLTSSSKISPTAAASSVCLSLPVTSSIVPSEMTSSCIELPTATDTSISLGTFSSLSETVSSNSESNQAGHSPLSRLSDSVYIRTGGQQYSESKPSSQQKDQGEREPNSELEKSENVEINCHIPEDPNTVCEHPDHDGKDKSCQERFVFSSEKQCAMASESPSEKLPNSSKRETKRKLALDQAHNVLLVTGKKSRLPDESQCAHTSAAQTADSPVSIPPSCEKPLPTAVSASAAIPSYTSHRKTRSASSLQLTDSFSDSVSDSALASIVMPGTQSPSTPTASVREGMSTDSLPDSVLANITSQEMQPSVGVADEAAVSPFMSDSVTDAALADVNTQVLQSQPRTENSSFIPACSHAATVDRLADMSVNSAITPANPELSTRSKTSVCFTQNAYNLGSSLPSTCKTDRSQQQHISLTDPVSVSEHQNTSSDDDAKNRSHNNKDRSVFENVSSETATNDTSVDKEAEEQGSSSSGQSERVAVKEREDGGEEERQTGTGRGEGRLREGALWVPVSDPSTGSKVYMNSSSGHTLTLAQWSEREKDLAHSTDTAQGTQCRQDQAMLTETPGPCMREVGELSPLSHGTLEALLCSHLEAEEAEAQSKWREGSRVGVDDSRGETVTDILSAWENPVFKKPEQILQTATRTQAGRVARCFFAPTAFTKSMLSGAKVVGQLDNKFVACLIQEDSALMHSTTSSDSQDSQGGGLVVLFDQHAAHERIRLEQLLADVYEKSDGVSDTEKRRIRRCDVQPPRTMDLSEEDVRLMQTFRAEFDRIGVRFEVDRERRDRVHAHTMPACMAQREANDRKRGKDPLSYEYLQIMIREHTQQLLNTSGAKQQLPKQIHRLLATHACKGAIKFGDRLAMSTCHELLSSLSTCDLPFQCAHGRPSIAPLISLTQLRHAAPEEKRPPRLWKLRKGQLQSATQDQ